MSITNFQSRMLTWVLQVLPNEVYATRPRAARFIEEAMELVQAAGLEIDEVGKIAAHVYGRPVGQVSLELGACMTTLAALANATGHDLNSVAVQELMRISDPVIKEKIRAKAERMTASGQLYDGG